MVYSELYGSTLASIACTLCCTIFQRKVKTVFFNNHHKLMGILSTKGDVHVYLFGQNHFIRRTPKITGGDYNWSDIMTWKQNSAGRWIRGPEGPLSYSKTDIFHTPRFFKNFSTNNAKFGASFEVGCCYWQHFFMNGTHYKVPSLIVFPMHFCQCCQIT